MTFVTTPTALLARLGIFLEHQVLWCEVRGWIAVGCRRWHRRCAGLRYACAAPASTGGRTVAGLTLDIEITNKFLKLIPGELLARFLGRDQVAPSRALALLRRVNVLGSAGGGQRVRRHGAEFAHDPRSPYAIAGLALLPVGQHRRSDED